MSAKALWILAVAVAFVIPATAQTGTTMPWESLECVAALEQIGTCMRDSPPTEGEGHVCCVTIGDVVTACGGPVDLVRAFSASSAGLGPEILGHAASAVGRCNIFGHTQTECVDTVSPFATCTTEDMMAGILPEMLTTTSRCCDVHYPAFRACSGHDVDTSTIVALDTKEKIDYFDMYHETCPNYAPEFCVAAAETLRDCMTTNGLLGDFDLATYPGTHTCCAAGALASQFCDNREVRDLVLLTDMEYDRASQVIDICAPEEHRESHACEAAIPDLFYQASTGRVLSTRCEGEACMHPAFDFNGVKYFPRFEHLPFGMVPNYECLRAPMGPGEPPI